MLPFICVTAYAQVPDSGPQPFSFYGQWRVGSIVGYAEFSAADEELKQLIGQPVVITKDSLKIGASTCNAYDMRASDRDTIPLLLDEYKVEPKDAGLTSNTLTLNAQPCGYVFRSGADIVFNQDGAFYRARRMIDASGD